MSDTCKHGAEWEYFEIFDEAGNPLETDRRLCMSCRAEKAEAERDELQAELTAVREAVLNLKSEVASIIERGIISVSHGQSQLRLILDRLAGILA